MKATVLLVQTMRVPSERVINLSPNSNIWIGLARVPLEGACLLTFDFCCRSAVLVDDRPFKMGRLVGGVGSGRERGRERGR